MAKNCPSDTVTAGLMDPCWLRVPLPAHARIG